MIFNKFQGKQYLFTSLKISIFKRIFNTYPAISVFIEIKGTAPYTAMKGIVLP